MFIGGQRYWLFTNQEATHNVKNRFFIDYLTYIKPIDISQKLRSIGNIGPPIHYLGIACGHFTFIQHFRFSPCGRK